MSNQVHRIFQQVVVSSGNQPADNADHGSIWERVTFVMSKNT